MDTLTAFLSEQTVQRIGWVLVHFLWQGCVIMALMGCALKTLSKTSSNTRYLTACIGLSLMVLAPVVTFMMLDNHTPAAAGEIAPVQIPAVSTTPPPAQTQNIVISYDEPALPEKSLLDTFTAKLEAALPFCVIGWIGGVAALSLWYLGGWCQLQRLRRIGTKAVSDAVIEKTSELASRLGVKRAVHIAESALVQVPAVIGWLKPVILLPATALTGLDEIQLKAMIAHELAHIKRCDYLVNIAQTVIEILGFYHPAVWWMSTQIRIERENACDDIAIGLLQNRKEYAKALFSMEAIRTKQHDLAVAANGGYLPHRISRLVDKSTPQHPKSGWIPTVVTFALIIALISTVAFTAQTPNEPADKTVDDSRVQRMSNLRQLGLAHCLFRDENGGKSPSDIEDLKPYMDEETFDWVAENIVLLDAPKNITPAETATTPVAYDKTLPDTQDGTTVVFADGHVEFSKKDKLKDYGGDLSSPLNHIEVINTELEPVAQGNNTLYATVKNTSDTEQLLGVHIYTRSPDYGPDGIGWGTVFFEELQPGETKRVRFIYKIQGPVTENTYVRVKYYNPASEANYDYEQPFAERYFQQSYRGMILPKRQIPQTLHPVTTSQFEETSKTLTMIQDYIRNKQYADAWELFSEDYQKCEYQRRGFEAFEKQMEPTHPLDSGFVWEKEDFLKLKPLKAFTDNGTLKLQAACDNTQWTIDFVKEDNVWKINWIAGYRPAVIESTKNPPATAPAQSKNDTILLGPNGTGYFDRNATIQIGQLMINVDKRIEAINIGSDIVEINTDKTENKILLGPNGTGYFDRNATIQIGNAMIKVDQRIEVTNTGSGIIEIGSIKNQPNAINNDFKATLPNGITVELLGIAYIPADGGHWWSPDGSPVKDVFWDGTTKRYEEPLETRQMVFRINGLESAPDSDLAPLISINIHNDSSPPESWPEFFCVKKGEQNLCHLFGYSFTLHDEQPAVDIFATIGQGPWETLATKSAYWKPEYSIPVETKLGTVIINKPRGTWGKTSISATLLSHAREWRFVAVDRQGQVHMPKSLRWFSSSENKSPEHQICQAEFDLSLRKIDKFHFQTMPTQTVIFKNVSLYPGKKSDVKIEMTTPQVPSAPAAGSMGGFSSARGSSVPDDDSIQFPKNWDEIVQQRDENTANPGSADPNAMRTEIYDVADILSYPGQTKNPAEKLELLKQTIIQTIAWKSWFENGGEGKMDSYANSKLIIWQTPQVHETLRNYFSKLREDLFKYQIAIETRIMLVTDGIMENIGADASLSLDDNAGSVGSIVVGPANSEEILAALKSKPLPEKEMPLQKKQTLDDLQTKSMLRATQAYRNVKVLTAPKVCVLNGESATMRVFKDWPYIDIDGQEKNAGEGVALDILPIIQNDGKEVLLRGYIQYSDILENDPETPDDIPMMQVANIPIYAMVESSGTMLIEGPELTTEQKDGETVSKQKQRLLVFIKPTIIEQQEQEAPSIPVRGGMGGGFSGRGVGGGFGGGMGGYGGGVSYDQPPGTPKEEPNP